jgi:hypothetical protein
MTTEVTVEMRMLVDMTTAEPLHRLYSARGLHSHRDSDILSLRHIHNGFLPHDLRHDIAIGNVLSADDR